MSEIYENNLSHLLNEKDSFILYLLLCIKSNKEEFHYKRKILIDNIPLYTDGKNIVRYDPYSDIRKLTDSEKGEYYNTLIQEERLFFTYSGIPYTTKVIENLEYDQYGEPYKDDSYFINIDIIYTINIKDNGFFQFIESEKKRYIDSIEKNGYTSFHAKKEIIDTLKKIQDQKGKIILNATDLKVHNLDEKIFVNTLILLLIDNEIELRRINHEFHMELMNHNQGYIKVDYVGNNKVTINGKDFQISNGNDTKIMEAFKNTKSGKQTINVFEVMSKADTSKPAVLKAVSRLNAKISPFNVDQIGTKNLWQLIYKNS